MAAEQRKVLDVPMNINEEYYQISGEILSSFPKFRPPVDLFRFREDIAVLAPYCVKGSRLTSDQVDEVAQLCAEGDLFVSRSDHPIYSRHIVKQLDLVLQDNNLKEAEIADICIRALLMQALHPAAAGNRGFSGRGAGKPDGQDAGRPRLGGARAGAG